MNTRRTTFWPVFLNCAIAGPLFGGFPYNVVFVPIPFSYVVGGVPSVIGAALFALWLRAGPVPGIWHTAAYGGMFGAAGSAMAVMLLAFWDMAPFGRGGSWLETTTSSLSFLLPHGLLGGAVVAGIFAHRWHHAAKPRSKLNEQGIGVSAGASA